MNIKTGKRISDSVDIKERIEELEIKMKKQERQLKKDVKEVYYSLHLTTMIKNALKDLRTDPELRSTAIETSLNLGGQFVLDKVLFRHHKGLKAYLLNAALKKLMSFFIAKNTDTILKKAGI